MVSSVTTLSTFGLLLAQLASAAPVAPPKPFGLRTVTYFPSEASDPSALERLNGIPIVPVAPVQGETSPLSMGLGNGTVHQGEVVKAWQLDIDTVLTHVDGLPLSALELSNVPAENGAETDLEGYYQVLTQQGPTSPTLFSIITDNQDVAGPVLSYAGTRNETLIFGSFVMCQRDNAYQLLWRGSSKAVWKAPTSCALVKLAVDY